MRISVHLDNMLEDLENLEPASLSEIVRFVKGHEDFSSVCMLARNSKRSAMYLADQCNCLIEEENPISDIQLAGLLVVVAEVDGSIEGNVYDELVSRASEGAGDYHWSKGMATSYLLHKEVNSEVIRKSA